MNRKCTMHMPLYLSERNTSFLMSHQLTHVSRLSVMCGARNKVWRLPVSRRGKCVSWVLERRVVVGCPSTCTRLRSLGDFVGATKAGLHRTTAFCVPPRGLQRVNRLLARSLPRGERFPSCKDGSIVLFKRWWRPRRSFPHGDEARRSWFGLVRAVLLRVGQRRRRPRGLPKGRPHDHPKSNSVFRFPLRGMRVHQT